MAEFLELEPTEIGEHRHEYYTDGEPPEIAFIVRLEKKCSVELGKDLLDLDFDARCVPALMKDTIDQEVHGIVPSELSKQLATRRRWDKPDGPTEQAISAFALLHSVGPEDIELGPNFIGDIKRQIDELPYDFAILGEWHNKLKATGFIGLTASVNASLQEEGGRTDYTEAYRLVRDAAEHFEDFALAPDDYEAAALVCFMSTDTRPLTRHIMTSSLLWSEIQREAIHCTSSAEQAALRAVKEHLACKAVTDAFSKHDEYIGELSDADRLELAAFSIKELDILGDLQQLARTGEINDVIAAVLGAEHKLYNLFSGLEHPQLYWKVIDFGHGFNAFMQHEFLFATEGEGQGYGMEFGQPEKDGTTAVILEDDPRQMEMWEQMVENHTPHTTNNSSRFTEPAGISELALDPQTNLFLLDIENGEDRNAGIRVGTQIVQSILDNIIQTPEELREDLPRKRVVIWSLSPELVKAASVEMHRLLEEMEVDSGVLRNLIDLNGQQSKKKLDIVITLKNWSFTDIPECL